MIKNCLICKKEFYTKPFQTNQGHGKYCSTKCYAVDAKKLRGPKSPAWKGGKYKTPQGYVYAYQPHHPSCTKDGYVREHRLIMEKYIGRFIHPKEKVHHKNGIKDDNRIENLELFRSLSEHTRYHALRGDLKINCSIISPSRNKGLECYRISQIP